MESTSFSSIKKKEKDIENIYSTELSEETNHSPKKKEDKINEAYDDSEVWIIMFNINNLV